jgi:hypothetical protein
MNKQKAHFITNQVKSVLNWEVCDQDLQFVDDGLPASSIQHIWER